MPNDVRPYFVPSSDTVQWLPWILVQGETQLLLPGEIDGWEPGTDLHLNRGFHIDVSKFEVETQSAVADCVVNVSCRSSTTDMVDSALPLEISTTGTGAIEFVLPGNRIAGTLSLYSRIVLAKRPLRDLPIGAARIPGSVFVEHVEHLVLERIEAKFPLQLVDFARTTYAPDASWHLDLDHDLEAPFMGAILLQINSRDTELCKAITHQGPMNDLQRALDNELEAGVAGLMIDLAVENRDDLLNTDWPADSVGEVLKNTLIRSDLGDVMPPSAQNLVDFRTQVAGAVRRMGHGRLFR